ncbi:hypothetical protein VV11_005635 [Trichodesmium erythraeum 21-75]|nr:hypothetical protein [Trichodesmium erythraeum 21-75]
MSESEKKIQLQYRNKSEWFLGVDEDTQPAPGVVPSLVKKAEAEG